jgi:hypothetical protein
MTAPTTLREEIRQILEASSEPLTNVEIFEKCKFAGDERSLAQALYQLTVAGDIKKAGERERVGARALALYMRVVHDGGDEGRTKAKKPRAAKPAAKKRGGAVQEARQGRTHGEEAAQRSAAVAGLPLRRFFRRLDGPGALRRDLQHDRARGARAVRLP